MNIRTRHMALLTYAGLSAIVLLQGNLITSFESAMALLAPIAGMFVWDKIHGAKPAG